MKGRRGRGDEGRREGRGGAEGRRGEEIGGKGSLGEERVTH